MNRIVQVLVAAASVVILVAGVSYLSDRSAERAEANERAAIVADIQAAETRAWVEARKAEKRQAIDRCRDDLHAYDSQGVTFAFVERAVADGEILTGDAMLSAVAACREMVSSATLSE